MEVLTENINNDKTKREVEVSIIIVCMNKLEQLFPCLESIIANTHKVKYEIQVVAYLFSQENLKILKKEYPTVIIIESHEIRGFSENNNLALHKAKGKYCFILNDDTKFNTPVVDLLVGSMEKNPTALIMSPKILFADGTIQSCGRPQITSWRYILSCFKLWDENKVKSPYTNQKGIFQSYNIVGAAFMIKTEIFKELGFFDETYFFCPEDIALSTLANKRGYKCYVDESISLYHLEQGSAYKIRMAIRPASTKGSLIFFSKNSQIIKKMLAFIISVNSLVKMIYWKLKSLSGNQHAKIQAESYRNVIWSVYSPDTPKEIFIHFYHKIR